MFLKSVHCDAAILTVTRADNPDTDSAGPNQDFLLTALSELLLQYLYFTTSTTISVVHKGY